MTPASFLALLHLGSPALPIGGFSYSQGLEAAIAADVVRDADSAHHWIAQGLTNVLARCELPFIAQQLVRWNALHATRGPQPQRSHVSAADGASVDADEATRFAAIREADAWFRASRESAELRRETEQMGWSLASLCNSLPWGDVHARAWLMTLQPVSLPTAFAFAAHAHRAEAAATLSAYAFSWSENQVAAALKAVPLGQLAGQRILVGLHETIARIACDASRSQPSDFAALNTFAPLLGILASRHESQYSRLFRS